MFWTARFSLIGAVILAGARASAQTAPDPCDGLPTLPGEGSAGTTTDPTATTATNATSTSNANTPSSAALSPAQVSQQFIRCALARFTRQEYRQAIRYFNLANRAAPSADLHYNIGRSHELLNEYDEAATAYERYLRDKVNAPDRAELEPRIVQLRDLARRRREAARQQDARALLTVVVDQPGARVMVDDREVGTSPVAPGLQLSPGTHRVSVEREGYQRWEGMVRARPGETGRAEIALAEATRFRTQPAPHIASFVLGGVGAAALVTGAALGIVAANNGSCVNGMGAGCIGSPPLSVSNVTSVSCDSVQGLTCARDGMNVASTIAISGGVALLTGAVIAWFVEAGSGRTERVRVERSAAAPTRDGASPSN